MSIWEAGIGPNAGRAERRVPAAVRKRRRNDAVGPIPASPFGAGRFWAATLPNFSNVHFMHASKNSASSRLKIASAKWTCYCWSDPKGAVLIQSVIFIMLIAILAAGILQMNLSGFMGTANILEAGINEWEERAALARMMADMNFSDPGFTGVLGGIDPDGGGPLAFGSTAYALSFTRSRGDSEETVTRTFRIDRTWDGAAFRYNMKICQDTGAACP